jgi:hypothetical protein
MSTKAFVYAMAYDKSFMRAKHGLSGEISSGAAMRQLGPVTKMFRSRTRLERSSAVDRKPGESRNGSTEYLRICLPLRCRSGSSSARLTHYTQPIKNLAQVHDGKERKIIL